MGKTMIDITCTHCGAQVSKPATEVRRSRKRKRNLFCSSTCALAFRKAHTVSKHKDITKICELCRKTFQTKTGPKEARFCSRSCASRGSMYPERREAQREAGHAHVDNLLSAAETLRAREAWKYELLVTSLQGREYQFEFELEGFVFDLALFDTKVLVEFDGPYHSRTRQLDTDRKKNKVAASNGYTIVRREVLQAAVISPETIEGL